MSWITDNGGIAIMGKKQTGKTTAARQLFLEGDRIAIWVMPLGDEKIPMPSSSPTEKSGSVVSVRSEYALVEAIANGRRHIIYRVKNVQHTIEPVRARLWAMSEATGRDMRVSLFVDEVHNYAPEGATKNDRESRDAIRKIAKEGEKRGVKFTPITQDPVSLDKQTLRQMEYFLIFSIGPLSNPFKQYDIDITHVANTDEYCAVLYQNEYEEGGVETAKVIDKNVCPDEAFAL